MKLLLVILLCIISTCTCRILLNNSTVVVGSNGVIFCTMYDNQTSPQVAVSLALTQSGKSFESGVLENVSFNAIVCKTASTQCVFQLGSYNITLSRKVLFVGKEYAELGSVYRNIEYLLANGTNVVDKRKGTGC